MSKEEQAKKEWEEYARLNYISIRTNADNYFFGIQAYQSALKREIEARKDKLVSMTKKSSGSIHVATYEAKYQECEFILELLTTVTPLKHS